MSHSLTTHARFPQHSVAKDFASLDGIVVDLGPYKELKTPICGINTSKISCFPEEKEILFFGGDTLMQINDIWQQENSVSSLLHWNQYNDHIRAIQGVMSLAVGTLCASGVCYNVRDMIVEMMLYSLSLCEEHPKEMPSMKAQYIRKLFEYQLNSMPNRITYDWVELVDEAKWLHPVVLKNPESESADKMLDFWNLCFLFPATKFVTVTLPVCYVAGLRVR